MPTQPTTVPLGHNELCLEWTARLKLLRSGLLLRQLGLALGLPIVLLGLLLLGLAWPPDLSLLGSVLQVMGLVAGIFAVLLAIVVGLIYRGGYDYHFVLDATGIRATTTGRTARTNRIINMLLMLSGRPSAAGAGVLAAGRQSEYLAWSDVSGFSVNERQHTLTLKRGPLPAMLVVCDAEHYPTVLEYVRAATAPTRQDAAA